MLIDRFEVKFGGAGLARVPFAQLLEQLKLLLRIPAARHRSLFFVHRQCVEVRHLDSNRSSLSIDLDGVTAQLVPFQKETKENKKETKSKRNKKKCVAGLFIFY
jgi:hypothetical protein